MAPPRALAIMAAGALAVLPRPARGYEYEVRSRTLVQGYQLRGFRVLGADVVLARRRFTQALSLEIRDIGDLVARRTRRAPRQPGPSISFSSYLRLDHDFGDWTLGELDRDGRRLDALDAIPELTSSSLALDLMYAYAAVDGLAGGRVDLRVGRQVSIDLLDAWAFDGATVRVHTGAPVVVEVAGGLRVRDASPLGAASLELDGTASADCREYVEAAVPGEGRWQIIDRSRVPGTSRFTSDLEICPQREQAMPTIEVAAATDRLRAVHARLSYRRSASRTFGLIDAVDRLDFPDVGLYPDDLGQAPRWAVNEERVGLVIGGTVRRGARVLATPWAAARWSLLHGRIDQALAGARIRLGDHALEPELAHTVPTFDGDSIFNVFAVEPSSDARLGWHWAASARLATHAELWLRRYHLEGEAEQYAGGGAAAARWRGGPVELQVDGLADGGWGGRRLGGGASAAWRRRSGALYRARAALIDLADEPARAAAGRAGGATHGTVQLGGTWALVDGVGLHVVAEATRSRITPGQVRVFGVLDLAFVPEI